MAAINQAAKETFVAALAATAHILHAASDPISTLSGARSPTSRPTAHRSYPRNEITSGLEPSGNNFAVIRLHERKAEQICLLNEQAAALALLVRPARSARQAAEKQTSPSLFTRSPNL